MKDLLLSKDEAFSKERLPRQLDILLRALIEKRKQYPFFEVEEIGAYLSGEAYFADADQTYTVTGFELTYRCKLEDIDDPEEQIEREEWDGMDERFDLIERDPIPNRFFNICFVAVWADETRPEGASMIFEYDLSTLDPDEETVPFSLLLGENNSFGFDPVVRVKKNLIPYAKVSRTLSDLCHRHRMGITQLMDAMENHQI